jgi:photosystem II stability/assembly factor-like uncharacterized protein
MQKYLIILILIFIFFYICSSTTPYLWNNVYFNEDITFNGIDNCDSLNILALGNEFGAFKRIFKSTDGGITWDSVYVELKDTTVKNSRIIEANDLSYPTKNYCIVVCDSGIFIKTTDGGKTWKQTETELIKSDFFHVSMFDNNHGIIHNFTNIIISHDGFNTWKQVKLPSSPMYPFSIQMISPYTIRFMAVQYENSPHNFIRFFESKDGGESWKEYFFPDIRFPVSFKFADSLFGYVVGGIRTGLGDNRSDKIYQTTDGGKRWKLVYDTLCFPSFGLTNLDILDRENAIFVGQFGKIYWTHDGGKSFIFDSNAIVVSEIPATIYTAILGKHIALIADFRGRILRSSLATDVKENKEKPQSIGVTPNPATDYIDIMLSEAKEPFLSVKVYDVLGDIVLTHHPAPSREGESVRLNVSGLAAGVYFVRVGGKMYKFVKL